MNADLISVSYGTATYRCPEGHVFHRFVADPMGHETPVAQTPCLHIHEENDLDACT